jgi:MFS family permease
MVEHARKIGIWIWAVIFSPYLGPFLSSLIAEYSDWRTSVWTLFGLFGLAVVLVVLFADETIYDRKHAKEQPPRPEGFLRDRFESLVGIRGWKATHRPSGWKEFGALWHIMTRPYFLLVLCIIRRVKKLIPVFQLLTFMWSIGVNVSLPLFVYPPPPIGYGFSSLTIALLYIGPMLATVIGETFGHFFNDWIANDYIRRHHGVYQPETRLWMTYISTAFMAGGLIFIGFVFENLMGFYVIEAAWGIYLFGMLTSVVAVNGISFHI